MSESLKPSDGQCAYFLTKKKRFCRFKPNQDQKYCPEHACVMGVQLERKRIVCPLNPKHTCYEDSLEKHLKKCNNNKKNTEDYYQEGINTGSDEGETVPDVQSAVKETSTERLKEIIGKVNKLYEEHIGKLEEDIRIHDCLKDEMSNPFYGLPALRHRRQQASLIGQLESLGLLKPGHCYLEMGAGKGQLSHWVREAVSCHDDAAFLLVDRSSIRYKVDGYHKEEEKVKFERIKIDIEHLNLGKVPMVANSKRPLVAMGKHLCGAATDLTLRCLMKSAVSDSSEPDISEPCSKRRKTDDTKSNPATQSLPENNLDLKNEERCSNREEKNAAAENLKCADSIKDAVRNNEERKDHNLNKGLDNAPVSQTVCSKAESQDRDLGVKNKLAGLLIALCCHHQCNWKSYVGKDFMRRCGFTASDFNLLTRLTSWAVCGWRDKDGSFGTMSTPTTEKNSSSDRNTNMADSASLEENNHKAKDLVAESNQTGNLHLSEKQKETVGWKCKRLIDYGRALFLQECGLQSRLKIYIDTLQTPENVVLIATPLGTHEVSATSVSKVQNPS